MAEPTTSNTTVVTSPTQTSSNIQQLLPLKLRESAKNPINPIQGNPSEPISPSNQQGPSHSRTGSSPAMMQNAQVLINYDIYFLIASTISTNIIYLKI